MKRDEAFEAYTAEYEAKKASYRGYHGEKPEVMFEKGARFYKDGDTVMFAYKQSALSEFTSKATDEQKAAWPKEWAAFRGLKPRKD